MRRRKSYLLTVVPAEGAQNELCGQVKSIATGELNTFSNIEELKKLLVREVSSSRGQENSSDSPDTTNSYRAG